MEPRPDAIRAPELTLLTQDEVRRLFAVITGMRDWALFPLAYHHGLRASEVSLLQRQDIHDRQGPVAHAPGGPARSRERIRCNRRPCGGGVPTCGPVGTSPPPSSSPIVACRWSGAPPGT